MASPGAIQIVIRGTTVQFSTTFYDVDDDLTQPDNATINIVYATTTAIGQTASVPMVPPTPPATNWTALWDTRGLTAPQVVYWSIHTGNNDPVPVVAEDGFFRVTANQANLPVF